jgi:catechol 2,3-dioxygenase-like lactoylglutathione lyase family enzyme
VIVGKEIMACSKATVTFIVSEYDEAIAFFTSSVGFILIEDKQLGDLKLCVLKTPASSSRTFMLLSKATTPEQQTHVCDQTGGWVFLDL